MKKNFKCPKCKHMWSIGKRLHASWICPTCKNSIVPTKEYRKLGYMPFKHNAMFSVKINKPSVIADK